jgi:hypothetical protein
MFKFLFLWDDYYYYCMRNEVAIYKMSKESLLFSIKTFSIYLVYFRSVIEETLK